MNFAEKIIKLRKRNGWSQEELADKLNVSRQAVSKWESEQSTPELENILQLANLFGVSTDYLLKADLSEQASPEEQKPDVTVPEHSETAIKITTEQAQTYIKRRKNAAYLIAWGVFLCMIAATQLILLVTLQQFGILKLSENAACAIALIILLVLVAAAVTMFVYSGIKLSEHKFFEGEFTLDKDARIYVEQTLSAYKKNYLIDTIIAVCLCVLSPASIFVGLFFLNDIAMITAVCATILLVAIAVVLFIICNVRYTSMTILIRPKNAQADKKQEALSSLYWAIATTVYLAWSFISGDWHITWIIWPIAGVAYSAIRALTVFFGKADE